MPATASRIDTILESLLSIIGNTIEQNDILPPLSARFPNGWIVTAGWPDENEQDSIRYAAEDGGYTIAVNADDPARDSSQKWIETPSPILNDGLMPTEVARRLQRVQITIWTGTSTLRNQIADAVLQVVATDVPSGQWVRLPDGTRIRLYFVSGPRRTNELVAELQTKRADIIINVDYGVLSAPVDYEEIEETIATIVFPTRTLTVTDTAS